MAVLVVVVTSESEACRAKSDSDDTGNLCIIVEWSETGYEQPPLQSSVYVHIRSLCGGIRLRLAFNPGSLLKEDAQKLQVTLLPLGFFCVVPELHPQLRAACSGGSPRLACCCCLKQKLKVLGFGVWTLWRRHGGRRGSTCASHRCRCRSWIAACGRRRHLHCRWNTLSPPPVHIHIKSKSIL